eukprot:scaffold274581_cov57-Attheya_sp.AAC.4
MARMAIFEERKDCARVKLVEKIAAPNSICFVKKKRGGEVRGVPVDPLLLDFCIMYLKKRGWNSYNNIAKPLKLPAVSYVQKKANEMASSASARKHFVHASTITCIDKDLENSEHRAGSNARLGSLAYDSYELREGFKWNHTKLKYIGGDDDEISSRYSIVERKFREYADRASNNDLEGAILDSVRLAKHHMVWKWTSWAPVKDLPGEKKLSEVLGLVDLTELKPAFIASVTTSITASLELHNILSICQASDSAHENIQAYEIQADSLASDWLPDELMAKFDIRSIMTGGLSAPMQRGQGRIPFRQTCPISSIDVGVLLSGHQGGSQSGH